METKIYLGIVVEERKATRDGMELNTEKSSDGKSRGGTENGIRKNTEHTAKNTKRII